MDKPIKIITLYLLLLTLCRCSSDINKNKLTERTDGAPEKETTATSDSLRFDYFVFGRFCSECDGNCAPIFRLSTKGNASTLWADYSNDFFSSPQNLKFATNLNKAEKIKLAYSIMWHLPKTLQNFPAHTTTFGCPDCSDGCGIYLEFRKSITTDSLTIFWLDLQENKNVPKEVYAYAQFVNSKINAILN